MLSSAKNRKCFCYCCWMIHCIRQLQVFTSLNNLTPSFALTTLSLLMEDFLIKNLILQYTELTQTQRALNGRFKVGQCLPGGVQHLRRLNPENEALFILLNKFAISMSTPWMKISELVAWVLWYIQSSCTGQLYLFTSRFYLIILTVSAQWLSLILQSLHVMSQKNNEFLFRSLQRGRQGGSAVKTFAFVVTPTLFPFQKRKKKTKEKRNLFSLIPNLQQIIPCHTSHSPTLGPGLQRLSWKAPQVLNAGSRIHSVHLNYTVALTDALREPREEGCSSTVWMSHVLPPVA